MEKEERKTLEKVLGEKRVGKRWEEKMKGRTVREVLEEICWIRDKA